MKVEPAKAEPIPQGNEQVDTQDPGTAFTHPNQKVRRYHVVSDHRDEAARDGNPGCGKNAERQPDAEYEETDRNCDDLGFVGLHVAIAHHVPSEIAEDDP